MSNFFCTSCQAQVDVPLRKTHLKDEWHIYNLKRVVACLPPISQQDYLKKNAFFTVTTATTPRHQSHYCSNCKKTFSSARAYENHAASKQHKKNEWVSIRSDEVVMHMEQDKKERELGVTEDANEQRNPAPLPVGTCFFCDREFIPPLGACNTEDAADRVRRHMRDMHNFALPYEDRLLNPVGMLTELGRVVGEEHACLACGRQFSGRSHGAIPSSTENHRIAVAAVRAHMLTKEGHCSVYCGCEDAVEVALALAVAEEVNEGEIPAAARIGGELYSQFYEPVIADSTLVLPDTDESAYEVRLPSGEVLGHRKFYQTVFRQRLPPLRSVSETRRRTAALTGGSASLQLGLYGTRCGDLAISSGNMARISRLDQFTQLRSHAVVSKQALSLGISGNMTLRGRLRPHL